MENVGHQQDLGEGGNAELGGGVADFEHVSGCES